MVSNDFKEYQKRWRLKHKVRLKKYSKLYYIFHKEAESFRGRLYYRRHRGAALRRARRSYLRNKQLVNKRAKIWLRKHPLRAKFSARLGAIRRRCEDSAFNGYKYYGGRGIKCLLVLSDIEYLWKRDKAYLMKYPTDDRINNNGNYQVSNCRFIELSDNAKKMNKEQKKKHCCLHGEGCQL